MYPYALIGNCQISALVSNQASLDWLCCPRPDSPPVLGKLLDPDAGAFKVELADLKKSAQHYISNTNVVETILTDGSGAEISVVDFCPRFSQHGRMYRPNMVFRKISVVSGNPKIKISVRVTDGWSKNLIPPKRGNSHLRFDVSQTAQNSKEELRLTTNMALTYLEEEKEFPMKETLFFCLSWGTGLEADLESTAIDFLDKTIQYWRGWVKHCSIPTLYQKETIRSALALKLHCFEDTGAILAALTTSLPEKVGEERNWDYRYCWLRDAYYVVSAFLALGHFEEVEGFLKFLLQLSHKLEDKGARLQPVYKVDLSLPLPEESHANWAGYQNSAPVRSHNQAAEHIQNDVYGEMVMTLAPIFMDERFESLRTEEHLGLLIRLAKKCADKIEEPDAGLWELRNGWQEHTFSNLMCWAGLERVARLEAQGVIKKVSWDVAGERDRAYAAVLKAVKNGVLMNGPKDPTLDSALLQLPLLGFPDKVICQKTVEAIGKELNEDGFLYRYFRRDDFGKPGAAFLVCSFWWVQALCRIGKTGEAKKVMELTMTSMNELGLFAEHFSPLDRVQSGNFPQAYSHVGLINAAFALSPPWWEVI